ncbi:hypothetical protein LTR41_011671 [Exophiala xenobiotica]|nr:hypothetical protein LTR41_011671 [Exophiala xenobiotica]KAK5550463.1 hypothetical protein LTR46_011535 [Exophiala xenobiotica]
MPRKGPYQRFGSRLCVLLGVGPGPFGHGQLLTVTKAPASVHGLTPDWRDPNDQTVFQSKANSGARPSEDEAYLIQILGDEEYEECTKSQKGDGKFKTCTSHGTVKRGDVEAEAAAKERTNDAKSRLRSARQVATSRNSPGQSKAAVTRGSTKVAKDKPAAQKPRGRTISQREIDKLQL